MKTSERDAALGPVVRESGGRLTARLCRAFAAWGLAYLREKGPRRYYALTPEGRKTLGALRSGLGAS